MKLYIIGPENGGDGVYYLLTEKGECLASHLCSHSGWAKDDLIFRRVERIKEWEKRFGKLDVLFVGQDDMTREKLIELNKLFKYDG